MASGPSKVSVRGNGGSTVGGLTVEPRLVGSYQRPWIPMLDGNQKFWQPHQFEVKVVYLIYHYLQGLINNTRWLFGNGISEPSIILNGQKTWSKSNLFVQFWSVSLGKLGGWCRDFYVWTKHVDGQIGQMVKIVLNLSDTLSWSNVRCQVRILVVRWWGAWNPV